ncbi:YugN family protein [Alteribacter populi]|uniref:YugN family protein n=1 Tax=Alteribacter populi TaxID=2011011 RepID=UPI000BBB3C8A|nr:YugN family protein [Alteribacter populi]
MKFEATELEGMEVEFQALEEVMDGLGFTHVYDYERVTFDYKFVDQVRDDVYYFRVQGYAVEGEVPMPHSVIKIMTALLGKHYYPHGVEYEGEEFPKHIVDKSKKKLESLKEQLPNESR